jgi:membrane-associated phospholipid phosphatase
LPAALIGLGVYAAQENSLYSRFDASAAARRAFPNFSTKIDDYLFFLPVAGLYGFNAFSSQNRHRLGRQTVLLLSSGALASGIMIPLKFITDVDRPNDNPHAFPSGHTTYAFVIAGVFDREFREKSKWISVGGYTVATATGVMRVLNNEHWLSDVLAGAGVGLLSVHTVYYIHERFLKHTKHKDLTIFPVRHHGATGLGFRMGF